MSDQRSFGVAWGHRGAEQSQSKETQSKNDKIMEVQDPV